ncbi:hypothetical protein [Xanthocytophaga agilis]|uniref:Uncharacterized protein n=1 Tax=Xanthocytophaga agilis TaxID=3048010 RepID=A0AAE3UET8_9BACT|nr:hypothetical protein [Xanthocytophaga agilis]MDJ1500642.1 hypothetical protein [Xanthocytophaga agilis]
MYILSEKELKDLTSINIQKTSNLKVSFENIDFFYVKNLLSAGLYAHLTAVVSGATGLTVTTNQLAVLDLAKRYMALLIHWDMLGDLPIKTTEKGAEMPDGTAEIDLIKEKRQTLYSRAEKVKKSILELINKYPEDFAGLYPFDNCITPNSKQDVSPIIFYETKWRLFL